MKRFVSKEVRSWDPATSNSIFVQTVLDYFKRPDPKEIEVRLYQEGSYPAYICILSSEIDPRELDELLSLLRQESGRFSICLENDWRVAIYPSDYINWELNMIMVTAAVKLVCQYQDRVQKCEITLPETPRSQGEALPYVARFAWLSSQKVESISLPVNPKDIFPFLEQVLVFDRLAGRLQYPEAKMKIGKTEIIDLS